MLAGGPPRERGGVPGGTGDPAAGSVGGQLGQTGRLGLATNRAAREERREAGAPLRRALPAMEANPQAGGTVRPNTSAGLAGGGPPMAGHGCQSVGV